MTKNFRPLSLLALAFHFLCAPPPTMAQLNAARQSIEQQGTVKSQLPNAPNHALTKVVKLDPVDFVSRATGLKCQLGFRNNLVAYVRITNDRQQSLASNQLSRLLASVPYFDENGKPTELKWTGENRLYDVFPPLGRTDFAFKEILKGTGVLSRSITVDVGSGRVVSAGSWQEVMRETGQYRREDSLTTVFRIFLRSVDGRAMAVAYKYVNFSSDRALRPEDAEFDYLAIMTPEIFWDFVVGTITERAVPSWIDNYEGVLNRIVPPESHDAVRAQRLALATIRYAEISSAPIASAVDRLSLLERTCPGTSKIVETLLLDSNFPKLGPGTRERHFEFAGEIGTAQLIDEFITKLPQDGNGRAAAAAAMVRLAERHHLPPPPPASATIQDFRAWGAQISRGR